MAGLKDLPGYADALAVAQKHLSPRYHELDHLERYALGTQYLDKPHWLDPRDDIPLLERGPHVVDGIVEDALSSYADLLLGEQRRPAFNAPKQVETAAPVVALDDTKGEQLEQLTQAGHKQSRLYRTAKKALRHALSCGTVCTIVGIKLGKLSLSTVRAKWCEPELAANGSGDVERLEIRYPFLQRYREERTWKVRAMIYRRVIDQRADTTYWPQPAPEDGGKVEKSRIKTQLVHGFGFCPVVWWPFDKDDDTTESVDGKAIHAGVLNELDALHRACSQHNRAGLYCGDPQMVETGVAMDHNPASMGRQPRAAAVYKEESPGVKAAHQSWLTEGGSQTPARKKGPGIVWRYDQAGAAVQLLTLPSDALGSVRMDAEETRRIIANHLAYVRDDVPEGEGGITFSNLSGEALKWRYRRQLSRCDGYRTELRDGWLQPVTGMLLRIVMVASGHPGVYLPGDETAKAMLGPFLVKVQDAEGETQQLWFPPEFELEWPPYFEETALDRAARSKTARDDLNAGLITRKTAVKHIAPTYSIEDADAYLKELEKEDVAKEEREIGKLQKTTAIQAAAQPKEPLPPAMPPTPKKGRR